MSVLSRSKNLQNSGANISFSKAISYSACFWAAISGLHTNSAHAAMAVQFDRFFNSVSAAIETEHSPTLQKRINEARAILSGQIDENNSLLAPLAGTASPIEIKLAQAVEDKISSTIKFTQTYKGVEVVGAEAKAHYTANGNLNDTEHTSLRFDLSVEPTLTAQTVKQILDERYQTHVELSAEPELKIVPNHDGSARLAYYVQTTSSGKHIGQEVYVDAANGNIVMEFARNPDSEHDLTSTVRATPTAQNKNPQELVFAKDLPSLPKLGARTVFSANTEAAKAEVLPNGAPSKIDFDLYEKVVEDGKKKANADISARNAYVNAGRVYEYYNTTFGRKSFDDKGTRLVSVTHIGSGFNNAFWNNEFKIMCYGDGDGQNLIDTTRALDVAGHEFTHGITAMTAKLAYMGESGALNESYSDLFGKLIDSESRNWDIGSKIVGPGFHFRAVRNLKTPAEFGQPDSNTSPDRTPTSGVACTRQNDRCGVHNNSGIANRAGVLIIEALGKEKAQKLFYEVLTKRLSALSSFHDARVQTEKACAMHFGGMDSTDCKAVSAAYEAVAIQ